VYSSQFDIGSFGVVWPAIKISFGFDVMTYPKLVESGDTSSSLRAHTKSTCDDLGSVGVSTNWSMASVCDSRVLDEVGINHSCSVKGESLSEFHDYDGLAYRKTLAQRLR
jgi:hypothetical protein